MPPTDATTLLRDTALRVTRPRVAVIEQLRRHQHADADTIAQAVRADLGKVSTQAIYDVLAALTDVGLVRRIEPAGSPARYEMRVGDNHHHAICRECGAIADVPCAVGERPCLQASDDHGYAIDEAEVIYWGHCPACLERAAATHLPEELNETDPQRQQALPLTEPSGIPKFENPSKETT
ncbi:MAG: transcriptional repressor [Intrasporangium sp.]|nr:Fur family transcriptional regulator [Intrasporangium sp.]MDN5797985.1 transcriptional repressor [Intrasporangium sp.]